MKKQVMKSVRIEPSVWERAKELAKEYDGHTMQFLLRKLLLDYIYKVEEETSQRDSESAQRHLRNDGGIGRTSNL
jgi:hypothetical protein